MNQAFPSSVYVGRFAPSPTGELHFGSLVAAVGSYLQARHAAGRWLIRVEDIDPPREIPGSSASILCDLERLEMESDGPVLYQSNRTGAYADAIDNLLLQRKAYWCACSRKDLPASGIYPGTCRNGLAQGKAPRAVRLRVDSSKIKFTDLVQGEMEESLKETVGDFIIQRADGLPAYQLAVVIDDAFQGITEVVRGCDLLDSTARQIYLQACLSLPTPSYAHLPLAMHSDGKKLGKRFGSDPVASHSAAAAISLALRFLGQSPPPGMGLEDLWPWAIEHWRTDSIPVRVNSSARP